MNIIAIWMVVLLAVTTSEATFGRHRGHKKNKGPLGYLSDIGDVFNGFVRYAPEFYDVANKFINGGKKHHHHKHKHHYDYDEDDDYHYNHKKHHHHHSHKENHKPYYGHGHDIPYGFGSFSPYSYGYSSGIPYAYNSLPYHYGSSFSSFPHLSEPLHTTYTDSFGLHDFANFDTFNTFHDFNHIF